MDRTRWLGLGVIAVLLVGALAYGLGGGDGDPDPGSDEELTVLLERAALRPCPGALSPELPALTLPCLGGGPKVSVRGTPALPSVVNVWGSWCGPCVAELPDFAAVDASLRDRVAFIGVNTMDTRRGALSLAEFTGVTFPSVVDTSGTLSAALGQGTPKTAFLDAEGSIVHVQFGRIPDVETLEELIATHLGVRAEP